MGGSAEDAEIDWSIAEAELSDVSVKQKAPLTYTGSELTAEVETTGQTVDGSKISFEYSTEKDGEYSNKVSAFVQAGEYTVYYKAMAKNHVEVTGTFKVTVKKPIVTTVVTTTTKATTTSVSATTVTTTTPSVTTPQVTFVSGDANLDGKLDVRDAVFIVKKLAEEQRRVLPKNADFNSDNKADVRDAAAIARFLAKKH